MDESAGSSDSHNYRGSATKFDIRDLKNLENADECLLKWGPNLRDIYCYKAYGSSVIAKHADYVENVAIDFRNQREDERPEEPSIRQTLLQFTNLTRLRLRLDDSRYDYFYFIQHLPHTMLEIHLLGDEIPPKAFRSNQEYSTAKKFLDLTKFSQLQALTLTAFTFDSGSLFGLERLKNLRYLRLDFTKFDKSHFDALKLYRKLEYLSLDFFEIHENYLGDILKANEDLKFLNLAGQNITADKYLYLWKLKKLEILRLSHIPWDLQRISFSSNLEYFDCSNNAHPKDPELSVLIWAFPNLKALNVADCNFSPKFVSVVDEELSKRKNGYSFKLHLGKSKKSAAMLSQTTSVRLQCSKYPDKKYARLFDYDRWDNCCLNDEEDEEMSSDHVPHVEDPIEDHFSPIDMLSDDCLEKIFIHFPITERLTIKQVNKRWRAVILRCWYIRKNIDIRDVAPHEDIQKFIRRSGRHLKDLYYYKSCGLSWLPSKIPNLRNLAIDFQKRLCECPLHNEEINSSSFNSILGQFRYLTRVMFKNFDFHRMQSFLGDLPETMEEIHVFNQGFLDDSDVEDSGSRINLSKFVNLRALTLTNFTTKTFAENFPTLYITGMEHLEKLTHLRLFGDMRIESSNEQLRNIRNLEHLFMKRVDNSQQINDLVGNNRNLRCLVISNIRNLPTPALNTICTLENLKYLRLTELSYSPDLWQSPGDSMTGIPSLEYLDYDRSRRLPQATLHRIIADSPNLKIVKIRDHCAKTVDQLMESAKKATSSRTDGVPLKIFLGRDEIQSARQFEDVSPLVLFDDVPLIEECYPPFEEDFWGGWWTED